MDIEDELPCEKATLPCLLSAGVDLLVFLAVGEELLCPAELSPSVPGGVTVL